MPSPSIEQLRCQTRLACLLWRVRVPHLGSGSLREADGVPDAGQPVGHQGEGTHEEDQDRGAVLGVPDHDHDDDDDDDDNDDDQPVDLARHPDEPEQARGLQQPDECGGLQGRSVSTGHKQGRGGHGNF